MPPAWQPHQPRQALQCQRSRLLAQARSAPWDRGILVQVLQPRPRVAHSILCVSPNQKKDSFQRQSHTFLILFLGTDSRRHLLQKCNQLDHGLHVIYQQGGCCMRRDLLASGRVPFNTIIPTAAIQTSDAVHSSITCFWMLGAKVACNCSLHHSTLQVPRPFRDRKRAAKCFSLAPIGLAPGHHRFQLGHELLLLQVLLAIQGCETFKGVQG